jgi:NAD(P)-dependent dehydrogenase (short-subunit alcohol dehydrogenase family)
MDKGNKAAQDMRAEHPGARVVVEQLDLANLASVEAFADRMLTRGQPIKTLTNNAGIMTPPTRHRTKHRAQRGCNKQAVYMEESFTTGS